MTETAHPNTARPAPATRAAVDQPLRLWLNLDALASGALGLLFVAGSIVLDGLLGIPTAALLSLGAFLVVWAAVLRVVSTRAVINHAAVWAVVVLNALWVVDSIAVIAFGWFDLTGVGVALVLAQAGAVAVFIAMQARALRV